MWKYKYNGLKTPSKFNKRTAQIILNHCQDIKTCFEIGAGKGELSSLLKWSLGCKITTMDTSKSACEYMQQYYRDMNYKFTILQADIFQFFIQRYEPRYDLVMSSGLIEHFKGKQQQQICSIHKFYSNKYVAVITPHATKDEIEFSKSEKCKRMYGYQKPMTEKDHDKLFIDKDWKKIHSQPFYTKDKLIISIFQRKNT